mgnify:CR=1 FL=1
MQPVTWSVIPEPPDRVEVVIRWATSMGLATVGPQPQIGASARRLHDATVDAARHPSAHLRDTTHESQIVYDAVAWMWNRRRFELAEDRARTIAR